MIVFGLFFHRR